MAKEAWLKNSLKIGLIACGFLALYILSFHLPPTAQAQNTASGSFAQPFSVSLTAGRSFLQINNLGQAASSVEYVFSNSTNCRALLESSADDVHWSVLAQAFSSGPSASTSFIYANGFYNYLRLDLNPDANAACLGTTFQGSYYGFSSAMPVNRTAYSIPASPITSTPSKPYLFNGIYSIQGMQCDNPGASAATLDLFDSATTPSAGSQFYQATIAAGASLSVAGTDILGNKQLWAGLSGAGSIECNFQLNFNGPWYPILPPAP